MSPSVAFIEAAVFSGSGFLIEGGYVLTNAHVVWPTERVRIVFPDRTEFLNVPVAAVDLMGDVAVLGPIKTSVRPLALKNGEALPVGSEVYLIGYPGERERFPQPTFGQGLLSRVRQWKADGVIDMTYFQTDAAIASGQSGGALVDGNGDVIGLTGYSFTEAGYSLSASAGDLVERVRLMISGADVGRLGKRVIPLTGGVSEQRFELKDEWDGRAFVFNVPGGTEVQMTFEGNVESWLWVTDPGGNYVSVVPAGEPTATKFKTQAAAPHFVVVQQSVSTASAYLIACSCALAPYRDPDDARQITAGQVITGALDYPADFDRYEIDLKAGEQIEIGAESFIFDPMLVVTWSGATEEQTIWDYDSGGGPFGIDAAIVFKAPHDGRFIIGVMDSWGSQPGGYILRLTKPTP